MIPTPGDSHCLERTLVKTSTTPKIPLGRIRLLGVTGQESSLKDHVPDFSLLIFLRHLA